MTWGPDMNEDHSFSHHDCLPYYLRIGDKWTPIDYSKHPSHWMKPLEAGSETGLIEIPSSWYLDDVSLFRNPISYPNLSRFKSNGMGFATRTTGIWPLGICP